MKNIRAQFPFFEHNPNIIYADSAATTQMPGCVIDRVNEYYTKSNVNISRGTYPPAIQTKKEVEDVRKQIAEFINAESPEEIFFTSGATESLKKTALHIAEHVLEDEDEILYNPEDHQAAVLPWIHIKDSLQQKGIRIKLIPYTTNILGAADRSDIAKKLSKKTKAINVTHLHNRYGTDSDVEKIRTLAHNKEIIINVDAAQSAGRLPIDVQKMGVDTLSFSGHKMFASKGVGVLYIKKSLQEKMKLHNHTLALETGTPNIPGILSLGAAITFIKASGGVSAIHEHLSEATQYLLANLKHLRGISFTKGPYHWECKDGFGIITFFHEQYSPAEINFNLTQKNIWIRSGNHCVVTDTNLEEANRISLQIYNTQEEIDEIINTLRILET